MWLFDRMKDISKLVIHLFKQYSQFKERDYIVVIFRGKYDYAYRILFSSVQFGIIFWIEDGHQYQFVTGHVVVICACFSCMESRF